MFFWGWGGCFGVLAASGLFSLSFVCYISSVARGGFVWSAFALLPYFCFVSLCLSSRVDPLWLSRPVWAHPFVGATLDPNPNIRRSAAATLPAGDREPISACWLAADEGLQKPA